MDKRSIWADEEVIIIKPLEVYCPVIKVISKLVDRRRSACERAAGPPGAASQHRDSSRNCGTNSLRDKQALC